MAQVNSCSTHRTESHFLQIPGSTPVPERMLRVIDHRGPVFLTLVKGALAGIEEVFQTRQPVIIYPAAGTGEEIRRLHPKWSERCLVFRSIPEKI